MGGQLRHSTSYFIADYAEDEKFMVKPKTLSLPPFDEFLPTRSFGYAHVTWEAMVRAVETLEQPAPTVENVFRLDSGKIPSNPFLAEKVG